MMSQVSAVRRKTMQAVKSKNTKPEMVVRRLVYALGYRYRLHRNDLPGKPDLVFQSRRKVILVHGCFWHGHTCKRGARVPKSNAEYWTGKIQRNRDRDAWVKAKLIESGWSVCIIWECELTSRTKLEKRLSDFLSQ